MRYEVKETRQFRKDRRNCIRRGLPQEELDAVVLTLAAGEELEPVVAECTDEVSMQQGVSGTLTTASRALKAREQFEQTLRNPNALGRVNQRECCQYAYQQQAYGYSFHQTSRGDYICENMATP